MTKARTKGAKREAKRRGRPPKEGVVREPSGRVSRNPEATIERKDKAMKPAIEARCRQAGMDPDVIRRTLGKAAADKVLAAAADYVRQPWAGCIARRRIAGEDDVAELWQVISAIRATRRAYLTAINAPADYGATASLPVSTDTLTGDAAIDVSKRTVDLRSEEERAHDARRRWCDLLNAMQAPSKDERGFQGLIMAVVINDAEVAGPLPHALRHIAKRMGWEFGKAS